VADLRLTTSVDDRPGAGVDSSGSSGDRLLSGRYRLRALIGTGASASVHLAEDVTLGRPVAVKLLHEALSRDEAFIRRFRGEARAAAALNHPNITAVFDWGESDADVPFLVMEHLAGGSLRALLDRHGTLSVSQTLVIGLEAARGLDYAHRRGFVHRDVKPANLLFDDEARLRVADFGLARALAEAAWTEPANAVLGTAKYASPEQAMGDTLDGRSDVYALSLVMIECLTGSVPFAVDTSVGTLMGRIGRVPEIGDEAGPLRALLERAAAPVPADRPTAGELATSLATVASQLERPAPVPIEVLPVAVEAPGDDITILGVPVAPAVQPERDDLTVIAEPEPRSARRWGRRRFEKSERAEKSERQAKDGDRPRVYDFMLEDDPDFVDDTTNTGASLRPLPPKSTKSTKAPKTAKRPKARRPLFLPALAAVVVLVLAMAFGTFGWQVAPVASAPVPDLTGHDVAEAQSLAQTNGWTVVRTDTRADDTKPGQVLAQQPPPGSSLDAGSALQLTVSLGQPLVDVPADLTGLSIDQAHQKLEALGLNAGDALAVPSEDVPAGQVISVAFGVTSPAEKGTVIPLAVSSGAPLRTIPPDLVGKSQADVTRQLQGLGLVVAPAEDFSEVTPKGMVKAVQPGGGAQVAKGSQVIVVVSKGPAMVTVPDVSGQSVEDAANALESAGLVIIGTTGSPSDKVSGTSPAAGDSVRKGTGVTIHS
jgi:serine/threonine-protein kinase